jgi:hypothetical protein
LSSGGLDPLNNPQAWDVVVCGQVTSPGICMVGEFRRANEWDVKKGKGSFGATTTYVGHPPCTGKVEFLLWRPIHFVQWDTFRPFLKYDPTKKSIQAVDIYHPSLADVDVTSVVTEKIGNIVHKGKQLYSITVDFLEYCPAPARSAVSTPTLSQRTQPGTTPGLPPDPVGDAQQKEIGDLLHTAQSP